MALAIRQIAANTASLPDYGLAEAIRELHVTGFRSIELLAFDGAYHRIGRLAGYWFGRMTAFERDELRRAVDPFEHVAVHLPFIDAPLFTHNVYAAEASFRLMLESMDGLAFLGGRTGVIHGNVPFGVPWHELEPVVIDTFRRLGDEADRRDVQLGIETMFPASAQGYVDLIGTIDHPRIGATVDVGHVVSCLEVARQETGQAKVDEYHRQLRAIIDALGAKVFHVHVHDLRASDFRDHCEVGTGVVDFAAVLDELAGIGYEGLLSFELEEPDCRAALQRSRTLVARLIDAMPP